MLTPQILEGPRHREKTKLWGNTTPSRPNWTGSACNTIKDIPQCILLYNWLYQTLLPLPPVLMSYQGVSICGAKPEEGGGGGFTLKALKAVRALRSTLERISHISHFALIP